MIKRKSLLYSPSGNLLRLLFLAFFLLVCLQIMVAYASAGAEIKGIEVREVDGSTEIAINSTSPLNYTIYKPSDPYVVVVELQNASPGEFTEKMVIDRAGVTEITPSVVEGMENVVRLEIALSVPADVKPVQKDNTLLLSFVNPEEEMATAEAEVRNAERIEAIDFSRTEDSILVKIKGDGMMSPEVSHPQEDKVVVDIPDVTTSVEAPKVYEPPMGGMRIGTYPDKTRIVFDLIEPVEYDVSTEENQIVVSFRTSAMKVTEAEDVSLLAGEIKEEMPVSQECGEIAASKEYDGEKINIDFQDAELVHIFRLLADVSGCNVVVSPAVLKKREKFTMRLRDVPWDQALGVILRNYGLSKKVEGAIIRIAPTKDIAKEEQEIARKKEAELMAGDLITKDYEINYADVDEVKKIVEEISKRAGGKQRTTISVDKRTKTLFIRDVARMHDEYARAIKRIDKPTPQVMIDARIVEVNTDFGRQFGIQWGTDVRLSPHARLGGLKMPGGEGEAFTSGNPFLVNLPAAVGSGSGGAISFGYIGAGSLRSLDLQLSAMENLRKGKVISNPKIVTVHNQKAEISQGSKIPYQTVSAEGTQTQFVDATLSLVVTPTITPDKSISMNVEVTKDEPGASTPAGPIIEKKAAKTNVLIRDGDTLVIGGIYKTNISNTENMVPLLGKIPILGWLFKNRDKKENTTELLIFITPKIIEPAEVKGEG